MYALSGVAGGAATTCNSPPRNFLCRQHNGRCKHTKPTGALCCVFFLHRARVSSTPMHAMLILLVVGLVLAQVSGWTGVLLWRAGGGGGVYIN